MKIMKKILMFPVTILYIIVLIPLISITTGVFMACMVFMSNENRKKAIEQIEEVVKSVKERKKR